MSEDQIERRVEREMNVLDRAFMRGDITQLAYDEMVDELCQWANREYTHCAA